MTVRVSRPWHYRLIEAEDGGIFDLHIESGFASWSEDHTLSSGQLASLLRDPARADLLYAALHPIRQGEMSIPNDMIDRIALGARDEVVAALGDLDARFNGACSNLLRILRGRPDRTWFGGWFEEAM